MRGEVQRRDEERRKGEIIEGRVGGDGWTGDAIMKENDKQDEGRSEELEKGKGMTKGTRNKRNRRGMTNGWQMR